MTSGPTGWNRLVARLRGEVPAAALEAYRRASLPVVELLEQVERRRLECSIDGMDPWTVPPAGRAAFLCAWNAFVLQTLGSDLLDADYRTEPATHGYVPPVTAQQVLAFYEPVEGWVNRAYQAQANPEYRLDVPAARPPSRVGAGGAAAVLPPAGAAARPAHGRGPRGCGDGLSAGRHAGRAGKAGAAQPYPGGRRWRGSRATIPIPPCGGRRSTGCGSPPTPARPGCWRRSPPRTRPPRARAERLRKKT